MVLRDLLRMLYVGVVCGLGAVACERRPEAVSGHVAAAPASVAAQTQPAVADAEQSVKPYPLDRCVVSGEALDSMDAGASLVYGGQEIKFCCKSCVAQFNKNPQKYLAKLGGAASTQPAAPTTQPGGPRDA